MPPWALPLSFQMSPNQVATSLGRRDRTWERSSIFSSELRRPWELDRRRALSCLRSLLLFRGKSGFPHLDKGWRRCLFPADSGFSLSLSLSCLTCFYSSHSEGTTPKNSQVQQTLKARCASTHAHKRMGAVLFPPPPGSQSTLWFPLCLNQDLK